jgi:hypothetical protein
MNTNNLETSRYPDLPLSLVALERAARRAKEIAARTGTAVIVERGGQIERLSPTSGQVPENTAINPEKMPS